MADKEKQTQLGSLDANVFIHPLFTRDPHAARCREILRSLEAGKAEAWLDPVTVHELTYALQKIPQFRDQRQMIVDYLLPLIVLDGIRMADKPSAVVALRLWAEGSRFGDARLAALAQVGGLPVCSVNRRDFPGLRNTF